MFLNLQYIFTAEKTVKKEYCENYPEPIHIESCNVKACAEDSYNWVVTSEWSLCSASCGTTGTQYQLYYCAIEDDSGHKTRVDNKFCSDLTDPKELRSCNNMPCVTYSWILTEEWGDCSEPCGETGVQHKRAECQRSIGGDKMAVGVRHCIDQQQPIESRDCNRRTCFNYKWEELDQWSDCSTTCGVGIKTKMVICKNVTYDDREIRVEEKHCDLSERSVKTEKCSVGACAIFKWVLTDEWTECSERCGTEGTKSRVFVCQQIAGDIIKVVNDSNCNNEEKEIGELVPCNRDPCHTFEWEISEWSECPSDCVLNNVTPTRTRNVSCFQKFVSGQVEVTEFIFCDINEKPSTEETCDTQLCVLYSWNLTELWSECSETCGNAGVQEQRLQCVESQGKVVDPSYCGNTSVNIKPRTRSCEKPPCIQFRYVLMCVQEFSEQRFFVFISLCAD